MQRLLVMSCSKRKRFDTTPLPALERYDGPSFHVLRRYLASHPASRPDVYILSARFGLIPANQPIPYYDQRLTPLRAAELRPAVQTALTRILARREYEQIFLGAGRDYAQALEGYAALMPPAILVKVAHGSQGKRLAQLHNWLYGQEAQIASVAPGASWLPSARRAGQHQTNPQLRGVEITLTLDQALVRARQALATNSYGSDRFHSWYVMLDGERIAPKWLVCQLSGLPPGAFTTQEALRILEQIGLAVHRADVW